MLTGNNAVEDTGKQHVFLRYSADRFCQFTGFFRRVQDLVVEDREVKRQAQAYGMCGMHLLLAFIKCLLVRFLRAFNGRWREEESQYSSQYTVYAYMYTPIFKASIRLKIVNIAQYSNLQK